MTIFFLDFGFSIQTWVKEEHIFLSLISLITTDKNTSSMEPNIKTTNLHGSDLLTINNADNILLRLMPEGRSTLQYPILPMTSKIA